MTEYAALALSALKRWAFRVYIALNMVLCAMLPYSKPRETISGMIGRLAPRSLLADAVDACHPHHENHCAEVSRAEREGRQVLGYRG